MFSYESLLITDLSCRTCLYETDLVAAYWCGGVCGVETVLWSDMSWTVIALCGLCIEPHCNVSLLYQWCWQLIAVSWYILCKLFNYRYWAAQSLVAIVNVPSSLLLLLTCVLLHWRPPHAAACLLLLDTFLIIFSIVCTWILTFWQCVWAVW